MSATTKHETEITVPEVRARVLRLCESAGCVPEGVAR